MNAYFNNIQSTFPTVYEARRQLNAEFFEKGRIIDAVSITYHPVQYGPMSHGGLEIEGSCYSLRNLAGPWWAIPKVQSYHKKIYRIRRRERDEGELAFIRFAIAVTPQQLHSIQNNIDNVRGMVGLSCMHATKRALSKYTGLNIPFPICLYPTTTAAALWIAKKIGSKKISKIDPYVSHRTGGVMIVDAAIAIVPEMMAIAACVGMLFISALIIFAFYNAK